MDTSKEKVTMELTKSFSSIVETRMKIPERLQLHYVNVETIVL